MNKLVIPYTIAIDSNIDSAGAQPDMHIPKTADEKLLFHIDMYIAGDKFGVSKLKTEAQRSPLIRLGKKLKEFEGGEPAEETIERLFSHTTSADALRKEVVHLYLKTEALKNGQTRDVIERHEPLAWRLGSDLIKRIQS